jgi:AcrR family transcriptional regulator
MQRKEPRASKGDLTRSRILEALEAVLHELPYEQVSIAEVTRRAQVTRPAFYFHFESLGTAVSSLMERLFDEFTGVAGDWYDHAGPSQVANLRRGLDQTVTLWRTHAVVMDAMMRAAGADPTARRVLDGWIEEFLRRALPVVRDDAPDPADADRIARFLVEMTFDAMARDVRRIVEAGKPDRHLAGTLTTIWARTLYPESGAQ